MENVTLWTTVASTAVGIIGYVISIIARKKNKSEKLVDLAKIVQKLPEFITEAEKIFGAGNGTAKMAYVLNKVQIECLKNNVTYNEDQFKGEIENILTTPEKKAAEDEI